MEFYYSFETSPGTISHHYAIFSPGEYSAIQHSTVGTWEAQLIQFTNWLCYLRRELESPNKWELFLNELRLLALAKDADDDSYFTAHEYDELKEKCLMIKDGLANINLTPIQRQLIYEKLD